MLTTLDALPDTLLQLDAPDLYRILPSPTLIHLMGERDPALFISVLLHGNEVTGWLALQEVLTAYQTKPLPRSLSIFIGNIAAARYQRRHLDQQPDFNRIWDGGTSPEAQMASQVIHQMQERGVFACIDIHNNTGRNPHYACVTKLDPSHLYLAGSFASTGLYFTHPKGLLAMAFAEIAPTVVLECGQPHLPQGRIHAAEYLHTCLRWEQIPQENPFPLKLLQTSAVVKVPDGIQIGFADPDADLSFVPDLDLFNFQEIPPHTCIGFTRNGSYLEVKDSHGEDVSQKFFYLEENYLRTAIAITPGMLTLDPKIIRQDCLGYLMQSLIY
jgi:hypothetical protein